MLFISTKAQTWTIEMIFGMVVFLAAIGIFYKMLPAFENSEPGIDDVFFEARTISENLLSKGVPENWNSSNLIRPGLVIENNLLDNKKLEKFYYLTKKNYSLIKNSLGINSDFAIYLKDNSQNIISINSSDVAGHNKAGFEGGNLNISKMDAKHLTRVQRVLLYNDNPVIMEVVAWQ